MQQKFNFTNVFTTFCIIGFISLIAFALNINLCVFYNTTGVYCPSCGMTRAYVALMHLDFKQAFYYNPMFFLVPLAILPFFIEQFFLNIKEPTSLKQTTKIKDFASKNQNRVLDTSGSFLAGLWFAEQTTKIKRSTKNIYFFVLLLSLLLAWIVRLVLFFPNEPVPYNSDNLITKIWSIISTTF